MVELVSGCEHNIKLGEQIAPGSAIILKSLCLYDHS
jgi:hypothetical protein